MLLLNQKKNPYEFYTKNIIDFNQKEIDLGKKYLQLLLLFLFPVKTRK